MAFLTRAFTRSKDETSSPGVPQMTLLHELDVLSPVLSQLDIGLHPAVSKLFNGLRPQAEPVYNEKDLNNMPPEQRARYQGRKDREAAREAQWQEDLRLCKAIADALQSIPSESVEIQAPHWKSLVMIALHSEKKSVPDAMMGLTKKALAAMPQDKLLLGLYHLESAAILCNHGAAAELQVQELRKACGVMPEECTERPRAFRQLGEALLTLETAEAATEALQVLSIAVRLKPKSDAIWGSYATALRQLNPTAPDTKFALLHLQGLLESGADVQELDRWGIREGRVPLVCHAAKIGSIPFLSYLIHHGVNATAVDSEGNTALHFAAVHGHPDMFEVLLLRVARESTNRAGYTALLAAAQAGQGESVIGLLSNAAKFVVELAAGVHCPATAPELGGIGTKSIDLFDVIISSGHALVLEQVFHHPRYLERLRDNQDTVGALYAACARYKQISALEIVFENHPEGINRLYGGMFPLHHAVVANWDTGVHFLVKHGASPLATTVAQGDAVAQTAVDLATSVAPELKNYLSQQQSLRDVAHQQVALKIRHVADQLIPVLAQMKRLSFLSSKKDQQEKLRKCFAEAYAAASSPGNALEYSELLSYFKERMEDPKVDVTNMSNTKFVSDKLVRTFMTAFKDLAVSIEAQEANKAASTAAVDPTAQRGNKNGTASAVDLSVLLSPQQVSFCDKFETEFDKAFGYFQAVYNGDAVCKADEDEEKLSAILKHGANALPNVPILTTGFSFPVGALAGAVLDLTRYMRKRFRRKQVERMMDVFAAVTPFERAYFVRQVAERLAIKYARQIHHLAPGSEGTEKFADCAVARAVAYITDADKNHIAFEPSMLSKMCRSVKSFVTGKDIPTMLKEQKNLYALFLDGIVRVTSNFAADEKTLRLINNLTLTEKWCSKGVFENTGIIVRMEMGAGESGGSSSSTVSLSLSSSSPSSSSSSSSHEQRWAFRQTDLDRYGYCEGTLEEAMKRDLKLGPGKGLVWGTGRAWPQVKDVELLPELALTHL